MSKQSQDYYLVDGTNIDEIRNSLNIALGLIGTRLDKLEGYLPDLVDGYYKLTSKDLSTADPTASLGDLANQSASDVTITGGVITITDQYGETIHQFSQSS